MGNAKIYSSVVESVGNTPLVRLNKISAGNGSEIFLKCEFRNPIFSVKDRIANAMISAAEAAGTLI